MRTVINTSSVGALESPAMGGVDSYTKLMLHFDGTFADSSSEANTVTNDAAILTTNNKKFGYKSAYVASTDLGIGVTLTSNFSFSATDLFLIDFWFCPVDMGYRYFFSKGDADVDGYSVYWSPTDAEVHVKSAGTHIMYFNQSFTPNKWYYIAFVGDGEHLKFYIDGVQKASISQVALG
jgi:hypothetical protein